MKNFIFISLLILIFVGCKKQQRNDNIVKIYNLTIPEELSFKLETHTQLSEGSFAPDILDSMKMNRLEKEATIQLLKIINKVFNTDIQSSTVFHLDDSMYNNTCHFFVYGKLLLQKNIKSIVIWEYEKDTDLETFNSKSLWLLNLKDNNKLCSVVLLAVSYDLYIASESHTYLKAGVFTKIYKTTNYISFWVDPVAAYKQRRETVDLFTHYRVNENGFVEFVKAP